MPDKDRDWSFVLGKHRLGKLKEEKKDPKSITEGRKRFKVAARAAALPKRFWEDTGWTRLQPDPIILNDPLKGSRDFNITPKVQTKWLKNLLVTEEYRKRGCIIIFGDYLADAAERVAFGLVSHCLRHRVSARVFHPLDLTKGPPKDVEGKEIPYKVVCLNRIHTDDEGPRRTLVRDFINKYYEGAFKIVVIYGDDAFNFFYRKIGLSVQALFFYPYQGQLIRSDDELKEH